jgi:tetratricopeptide (TPR) repeat protein
MTTKPPPGKGKPFLGDDDLFSELEAWDATFDALHGGPEAAAAEALGAKPMEWPAPVPEPVPDPTTLSRPAPLDLDDLDDSHDAMTLDAALTLDGSLTVDGTTDNEFDTFGDPAPDETDFSEVGASGRPQTLGDMLGPAADQTTITPNRAGTLPPVGDDDEVFTSASRPTRAPADPGGFDDELAPPPEPPRRTAAANIVRRVTAAHPAQSRPGTRDPTPSGGVEVAHFAEQTRIIGSDEIEARAQASKHSFPVLPVDDDAYDDIEIDAKDDGTPAISVEASPESAPVQRRTAHVVRRTDTPTRPPPVGASRPTPGPVIEMEMADLTPLPKPEPMIGGEDDFSDVAAAVGAANEPMLPELDLSQPEQGPRTLIAAPSREELARLRSLRSPQNTEIEVQAEDELQAFDDEEAPLRTMIGAPPADLVRQSRRHEIPDLSSRDDEGPRTMISAPHPEDLQRLRADESQRPPALADFYPRVKTPTSVPPLGVIEEIERAASRRPLGQLSTPLPEGDDSVPEPGLDLDQLGRDWPEQAAPLSTSELDEAAAKALLVYEREVATLDDSATSAALRIEAGRLCERLADLERARAHYDAALLADPRATGALRGLRRIARASGDLAEVTRHLETEIAVAGALERRPLGHYRIDLLLATGEQDMARVAVGEILDSAPSDIRALLAQLELAFLDGRADEFGATLEQIAKAVTDNELRAAVQSARGILAAHHNDSDAAAHWFAAAAESDPQAIAARLGAVRHAAARADGSDAARALLDLARQVEAGDPITAAAAALRAQAWAAPGDALIADAGALATAAAPQDLLVARLAAESSTPETSAEAHAHWARTATAPVERAYAAGRAAELDTTHAAELWGIAVGHNPDDDYAAAQLRTAHVAGDATQASIDVDLAIATTPDRERARLRAAYGTMALGKLDVAIDMLAQGRAQRPDSLALLEALGEAYAAAGKWTERAELFAELAKQPGEQLDGDVAKLRSAIAWEEAVGAAAAGDGTDKDEMQRLTAAALAAWEAVLEQNPHDPAAHAAAIVLANRLSDRDVMGDALARAQAAERQLTPASVLSAGSLAFRRARLVSDDPQRAESILRDIQPVDDPRRTVALMLAAAKANELGDAAAALEERATQLAASPSGIGTEVATLRLRAAQLALDAGDAPRATRLLQQVETALPTLGVIADLLAAARRRAGDRPSVSTRKTVEPPPGASRDDAFVRVVRDADLAHAHGDPSSALALYQRALELRPSDPLAVVPLVRVAIELADPAPLTALALAQLRTAEAADDSGGKAAAYEWMAQIDSEVRRDDGAAQIALESASQADATRIDLLHRLERGYVKTDEVSELIRLRRAELAVVPQAFTRDRGAIQLDIAGLATRDHIPEVELAEIYKSVLDTDPTIRLALLHLESIVRRSGPSLELARLEEAIATYFEGDPKAQAAFWTRAGETLAEVGQIDAAVQRFGKAEAVLPGHVPALEGWRQAALKGALWIDVAEAATRQATASSDDEHKARLHHFAGVALMDKGLVGDQAMQSFRRALEADPAHRDSFLRLRILLEEDGNHDDLATLLANRLEVEENVKYKVELHRALAELHRNFLSDRETATTHYRAILDYDPNDLHSHSAIADIAWELGNWQDAADALMARARLEREPEILKTLCFRLGLIYADRLVDIPMALKAFQRALTYQPDDENTLVRLADLAAQIGEWKLALGACERLVKNEADADKRVAHLHRVARIFLEGFNDNKRAERALNLALDSSPTNDIALERLVQFYKDARDLTSVRVHLNRVAGTMRARVQANPKDGVAYRVISRAMAARANTNAPGSMPIARAAAQLAELLGAAGEQETKLLAIDGRPDVAQLIKPEADEVIFPRGIPLELRQVFQLLGDRIAKHVGVNVQAYGVSRGDRVRAKDNPVAAVAQSVATSLGFGEIDVYLSARQPFVMVAEPTSPVSLVLGTSVTTSGGDAIRFATGGALKMAQASLAIPARLPVDELGVLVVALLRLFQPDFPINNLDQEAVNGQFQKLRRLIPTNLMNELRPFALAIDPIAFRHTDLARDLKIAQLRAGLVASGSLLAGLTILAASSGAELPGFLADPVAQGLVSFALSEDHAAVAR